MSATTLLMLLALAAPVAPSARAVSPRGAFIVGVPDRLAAPGDHRQPRRYERIASVVAAFADVDDVGDAIWLRHELEGYARRAAQCAAHLPDRCAVVVRRLAGATVLHLVSGARAEMLWTSGHHAVRLGWRRIVETPSGTMTVDDPPADFAAALLGEFPSDLGITSLDAARWADDEVDRRLDYADRALDGCAMASDTAACLYFARASLLAVEDELDHGDTAEPAAPPTVVSVRLRIAAARLRRAAARQSPLAAPICPVPGLLDTPRLAALSSATF
jgi:hypothetical protein